MIGQFTAAANTLNAVANRNINEGDGLQTVNLSGIGSGASNEVQSLTVTASSSNPGFILRRFMDGEQ